ncbi:MAG: hypothetical protein DWI02_11675, partial [Planctomycetota bacterium]
MHTPTPSWLFSWAIHAYFSRLCRVAGLAAGLFLALQASFAIGQNPFEDLRLRIERLEEENQELKSRVGAGTRPVSFQTELPPIPPPPGSRVEIDAGDLPAADTDEEQYVNSLIEKYLRRRPRETNPDDAAQEGKLSALDTKVAGLLDRLNKKTFLTAV